MELSLRMAAHECAERIAVVTGGEALRYGELAERVAGACAALLARGLGAHTRVAISATNRLETLVAVLSLIELGIPFIPIHPRWTAAETAVVLDDARPACHLREEDLDALAAPGESWPPLPGLDPATPLAILYTSGTTGTPKGAVLSRAAFIASAAGSARNLGWRKEDRWLLCLPLCHIGGLSIVTRCLLARRTLVLLPRYEAGAVLESIDRDRATLLSAVPTMLHGLLDCDRRGALRRLRAVLSGGAATPFSLLEQAAAAGVNVLTTYGLTEACSQVTVQPWREQPMARRGSGVPLSGVELAILDQDGKNLPADAPGRICVRGPTVMTGYWNREALAGQWFDTGDIGALDEAGHLHVHARRTDLIVTGGENVYPAEVEQALAGLKGVSRALVFGVSDPVWGAVVAAAVVPSPAGWDERELETALQKRLAPYKRPRLLALVDAIPELSTGKPDRRRALAEFTPRLRPFQPARR